MKLVIGFVLGFLLADLMCGKMNTDHGRTETCVEERPWLMGKKWMCTPEEKRRLTVPNTQAQAAPGSMGVAPGTES